MPVRRDGPDLLLSVRLTPRASRARLGGIFMDAQSQSWLQASVTAPPDKGKANAGLVALLAKALGLAPSSILLETGEASRLKRLRLADCTPSTEDQLRQIASKERNET